jgi:hypothetical protein
MGNAMFPFSKPRSCPAQAPTPSSVQNTQNRGTREEEVEREDNKDGTGERGRLHSYAGKISTGSTMKNYSANVSSVDGN